MKNNLMFKWKKPKKTLISILFIFSILLLVLSVVGIGSIVVWNYYPKAVNKVEKFIPNFYDEEISEIYEKANEKQNTALYLKLYKKLFGISTLHKYYSYWQKSVIFLIDKNLNDDNYQRALLLVENWKNNYPNDFVAKFKYIDVLEKDSYIKAKNYFDDLYKKHSDINAVSKKYHQFLIKHGYSDFATNILSKHKINKNIFKYYYISNNNNDFSENQSIYVEANNYKTNYKVNLNRNFLGLKGLRIDIDNIPISTVLLNENVKISTNLKSYQNIVLKPNNDLKKLNNKYVITGLDPYFLVLLPEELKSYSGDMNITFSVDIGSSSQMSKDIIKSPEWQLFFDSGSGFNSKELRTISLSNKGNIYKSMVDIKKSGITKLRIDLPSIINCQLSNFKIKFNSKILTKNNIIQLHNIILKDNKYVVIDKDPYIVLKLKTPEFIDNILVEMEF